MTDPHPCMSFSATDSSSQISSTINSSSSYNRQYSKEAQVNRFITNCHTSILLASLVTTTVLQTNRLDWAFTFTIFTLHTCIAYNSVSIQEYKVAKFHTLMIVLSLASSTSFTISADWSNDLSLASGVFSWAGTSLFLMPFVNVCTVNY